MVMVRGTRSWVNWNSGSTSSGAGASTIAGSSRGPTPTNTRAAARRIAAPVRIEAIANTGTTIQPAPASRAASSMSALPSQGPNGGSEATASPHMTISGPVMRSARARPVQAQFVDASEQVLQRAHHPRTAPP